MAIYHCCVKIISRGKGRSAVGAAAYRSGTILKNEYDGITHDYTKKRGVVYSEIMLCQNAPSEFRDRSVLWNAVEESEKNRKAQLAREYEVALPAELTRKEQIQLVHDYVQSNFVNNGMCADFSIHDKRNGNPHAHIMLTMRPIEQNGTWDDKQRKEYVFNKDGSKQYDKKKHTYKCRTVKTTCWDDRKFLEKCREDWAKKVNRELERKGLPDRVDDRSYEAQGKPEIPSRHLGVSAKQMECRGVQSERGNENRNVEKANIELKNIEKDIGKISVERNEIQQDIQWSKIHEDNARLTETLNAVAVPDITDSKAFEEAKANIERVISDVKKAVVIQNENFRKISTRDYTKRACYNIKGSDGKISKISYLQYHVEKYKNDLNYINNCIEKLENVRDIMIVENASRINLGRPFYQAAEIHSDEKLPGEYIGNVAAKLESYRESFIQAMQQEASRTVYKANPIYRQQVEKIKECVRTINQQTRSIEALQDDYSKLGKFQVKEKRRLQDKIGTFEKLRALQLNTLRELGVPEFSQAESVIKEKAEKAERENSLERDAAKNRGANIKAEAAKTAYLKLASTIPMENRKTVLDEMIRNRHNQDSRDVITYQAELAASKILDSCLSHSSTHEKIQDFTIEHERL